MVHSDGTVGLYKGLEGKDRHRPPVGLSEGRPQERRLVGEPGGVKIGDKMTGETSRELSNCELK